MGRAVVSTNRMRGCRWPRAILEPGIVWRRLLSICTLALLGVVGCTTDEPRITETSPNRLLATQLPSVLTVRGEGLAGQLEVDLDNQDEESAVGAIEAHLGSVSVAIVQHSSPRELQLAVPAFLPPASYDLTLILPRKGTLYYPNALTLLAATDSTDSSETTDGGSWWTESVSVAPTGASSAASEDSTDVGVQTCSTWQFGAPQRLTIQGLQAESLWAPVVSADGLTLYFGATVASLQGLWVATRTDRTSTVFTGATRVPQMVTSSNSGTPKLTKDELGLYFYADPWNGKGDRDLYKATRATLDAPFANPIALTELSSIGRDHLPWVSDDELTVVFLSDRVGSQHLWTATRSDVTQPFGPPTAMSSLNLGTTEGRLSMADGGLTAYYTSVRENVSWGGEDIWVATRASTTEQFGEPRSVSALNTGSTEQDLSLSPDEAEIYFVSNRTGTYVIYRATRSCADL